MLKEGRYLSLAISKSRTRCRADRWTRRAYNRATSGKQQINTLSAEQVQPGAFHLPATLVGRKLDSHMPLRRKATLGSHSPDDIEKYAFVVVLQIGQVVGEVCEIVADANLKVLADMTIDCGQRAAAALT